MGPATENLYTIQLTRALENDSRFALRKWALMLHEHDAAHNPAERVPGRGQWRLRQLRRDPSTR
jgi:hypothetical protein